MSGVLDPIEDARAEEPIAETPEATVFEEGVELERTIGLTGGLTIGIGTMIGAGIFVFPGIAAGRAGPAAAGSFAIGAVIALLVAVPASELATAMPRSGGGYFFISRGLGPLPGTVVGLSLWTGLVFASAFYLVGFGHYALAVLAEAGVTLGIGLHALAVGLGILLTVVSIAGTENTTKLQNVVVSLLIVILTLFLTYGALDAVGVFGRSRVPETFMPFGPLPILSTAALVFTSYLGFAQVATVAGEIKNPARNLPVAMVGSVVIVGVFYVATILVATSAFGSVRLATFAETAMVEVARFFLGRAGAAVILVAGLLATVSSANASILSSSRTIYALSRDARLPARAAHINLRFGTPHVALLLAGGPTLVLVATGEVEVLAEVASFLHLVMYGLICVTLIVLRRRNPEWYRPAFRMPGSPILPAIGAVASFGLVAAMQTASQIIGLGVLLIAWGWYQVYPKSRNAASTEHGGDAT
ncbi:MAG: amino acid permease [Halobacteriales archaeon]|nr:amino acid permease [Halobacteriales archaeon]